VRESVDASEEFEELMPRRLTNIAPLLRRINFKNSLSFELDSISFCLSLLAVITNNNNNNFSNNNLTKTCTLLDKGQTARLHNTLYITSLVLSHYP
jgi:hypothetical protein